ncbi:MULTISPECIES: photosystem I reaction center subunit XI [Leptolyngbya]|jgi:photosystem I subunit 11|uniref:Photosystem I reaction center subunit XI n=1 Tax=Leptolyngbya boryana NIES-2135 TaxID=1973484 RepID=A0A1Z4JD59_LEPBY|nr:MULTISPECIES: photosystem I reaction center subunit XI [Leptolyngbya]BAY54397.1 photosystem I reaction center protein subunit XI [Leptolyngbya boryana NIES-2135]MBD1856843.1 photosystem I reaction center subunit XI [Leptolyngbya sp. FACHB-1624]MBD2370095.1 photosystem I reaction center subunit XI [Leptolyngbya sp. FACHB-161]MBD2376438.1 photosystem I reaction center subunit XI [Leptolyngbya sp. FACHB-238]MBD2400712.1 photosystem I reaction center subunit XI [Leptolyngbya sp. FACHB-239]
MQVLRHPEATNDPRDPRNNEVVSPGADIYDGNLSTPINSSPLVKSYLSALPAYRQGLSPQRRGLEVGFFHGLWIILPFTLLGPLRDTPMAALSGLLSGFGLLLISALSISLYGATNPPAPTATITTPNPPQELATGHGWNEYAGGFLLGGVLGAVLTYFLLSNTALFQHFGTGL